jgi:hypothetical protein
MGRSCFGGIASKGIIMRRTQANYLYKHRDGYFLSLCNQCAMDLSDAVDFDTVTAQSFDCDGCIGKEDHDDQDQGNNPIWQKALWQGDNHASLAE